MSRNGFATTEVARWTPASTDEWLGVVHETDHANLAHAPEWFTAIRRAYGHTPMYLRAQDLRGACAVLPAFLIRSRVFGTVVTSMPFLDGGGPCAEAEPLGREAVQSLVSEAARLGAGSVELRSTVDLGLPTAPAMDKCNMVLQLPRDVGELWRRLDAKVRNQVRKAERSGLSVEFGHQASLDDFYRAFAVNMRDLGSPVHARRFFLAILEAFGDRARIALVRKDGVPIGGLFALAFKDTLTVPWASSLREYLPLCPNVLLYWEILAAACREGFRRFDFGRSSPGSGTHRFKRQWGAEEVPLYSYQIPLRPGGERSLSGADARGARLVSIWKHLPVHLSRWVGPHVRRYLTQ